MAELNNPFYFAVPRWASRSQREKVPAHLASEFGLTGRIELARTEPAFRLYRIWRDDRG